MLQIKIEQLESMLCGLPAGEWLTMSVGMNQALNHSTLRSISMRGYRVKPAEFAHWVYHIYPKPKKVVT